MAMGRASLVTVFVTVFLDLLGFGLVVPYLPGVARDLGASDFVATLIGASYSAGQLLFVPTWGALSDRVGRRPVLVVSIAATVIAMLILGSATSLWMIFLGRALGGVATANLAVAQAYIADVTTPAERPRGMALVGVAIGLGFVLGPAIGGLLAAWDPGGRPGALPGYVAAGLSFVNLLFALFALPESLPPERRSAVPTRSPGGLAALRRARLAGPLARAIAVNLVVQISFAGLEQTYRLYNEDGFGMSAAQTGQALFLSGVVLIVVQGALMPRLARTLEERTLVIVGVCIEAVGFAVVALARPSIPLLLAGTATLSFGSALANPSLPAFVSRCTQASKQGGTLGALQASGSLARVIGPPIAGVLYQLVGPSAPYAAASAGMLLAALLAVGLRAEPAPQEG